MDTRYVNQKINEIISTFITMETQTTYNRVLEKEVMIQRGRHAETM